VGGKSSTSTSQVSIPPQVLAQYNTVTSQANALMGTNPATGQPNTPFQFYSTNPNAFVAPLDPTQQAGIAGTNYYANAAQPYYQGATDLTLAGAGPANLGALQTNRYMSPFLSDVYGTQLAGEQMLNQQQASGLQGQAIQAGAFGGDRSGVAAANLAYQQNLANNQTNAGLLQAGYTQAQNTAAQQQAAQLAAQQANLARLTSAGAQLGGLGTAAQTAGLQGAQAQQAAGLTQQQTAQAGLQALYNQFLQAQAYPFQTLGELANISEGIGALSGSTTTSTQPSSFFSDERLKEDIQPIGETYDGQKIVKFKYKGKPGKQIGLIAQDVEKHHPDAVGLMGGYKTVDYDRATDEAAHRGHFYSGGLVPSSEGGAVGIEHAGEGFADGGMPGVAAQQLNLYSNLGLIPGKGNPYMPSTGSGGLGGMGGGQPRQLMVAHEPTQHQPTMMDAAQSMSNWANLGEKGDAALFGKTGDGGLVGGIKSLSQGFQNINAGGTFGGNSQEDVVNNLRSKYGDPSQPPPVASDASPSTNYRGGRIHEAHGGLVPRHPYAAGGISTPYENTGDDSKGYMGEAQDAQPAPPKQLQTASTPSQGPSGAQQLGSLAGGIGGLASGVGMAASGLSKLLPLLAARNGGFIHEPYHDDAPHHHGGGEGLMGFGALAARRRAAGGLVGRKGYQGDGAVTDDTQDGSQDTSQDVNPNGPSLYDRIIGRPTRQEIMERWAASQGATNPLTTGFDMGLNQNQLAGLIAHHPDDPNSVQAMKNSRQAEVAWLATRPWGNTAEPDRSGLGVLSDPYGTNVPETIVNSGPVSTPVAGRTGSYPPGDYPFNEPSVAGGLVPAGSYPPGDRPFNEPRLNISPADAAAPANAGVAGAARLPAGAATPPGGLLPTSSVAPSNNAAPTPVGGEGQTPAATRQTPEGPGAFDKGGWMERNQSWLVPLLSGIGGMASSNSRYLGSALLQGLGAGAQAYEGVQGQMAQRARSEAETAAVPIRTQAEANRVGLEAIRYFNQGYRPNYDPNVPNKIVSYTDLLHGTTISPDEFTQRQQNAIQTTMPGMAGAFQPAGGITNATGQPRNIRNNNPGNIEDGDFAKRQPGYMGSDGRFAVFQTPNHGAQAMDNLLQSYANSGLNTPASIVGKWAPRSDNQASFDNYVKFVSNQLGVGPNDQINMSDPNTRAKLRSAMTAFEGGQPATPTNPVGYAPQPAAPDMTDPRSVQAAINELTNRLSLTTDPNTREAISTQIRALQPQQQLLLERQKDIDKANINFALEGSDFTRNYQNARNSLNQLNQIYSKYEGSSLDEKIAALTNFARGVGLESKLPKDWTKNASNYTDALKLVSQQVADQLQGMSRMAPRSEIDLLNKFAALPSMDPEARQNLLRRAGANLEMSRDMYANYGTPKSMDPLHTEYVNNFYRNAKMQDYLNREAAQQPRAAGTEPSSTEIPSRPDWAPKGSLYSPSQKQWYYQGKPIAPPSPAG